MFDLQIDGGIARLTLVRPERRNPIPLPGWAELGERARQAEAGGARVLIVGGVAETPFCSGADVADFEDFHDDPAARTIFRLAISHGLGRLRDLGIPTIAGVDGACYGAGVALAMACDVRLAGPNAQFAITPAKLGIGYPQEDVHRLVSLVGPGQAARLLFTAAPIGGAEAARVGLAELFADDDFVGALEDLAGAMLANDGQSLTLLKRGIGLAAAGVAQDDLQDRAFDALLGSDTLAERLAAHRQRPRGPARS
jgi:enoyl-CoA hydratase/carnithine racemase